MTTGQMTMAKPDSGCMTAGAGSDEEQRPTAVLLSVDRATGNANLMLTLDHEDSGLGPQEPDQ